MSHSKAFPNGVEDPCVVLRESRDGSVDKGTKTGTKESNRADDNEKQRVLKEVGLTSTTFIGPAFPPRPTTVKSDIEDTLSEFYRELEKIDTPAGANGNPGTQDAGLVKAIIPPYTSASRETPDLSRERTARYAETDGHQKSFGQKQPPWPHWYQNEPYLPRRPRPGMDPDSGRAAPSQNQWHDPQTVNRPPNSRIHRLHVHHPPPPSAFPNQQNLPPQDNQNWSSSGAANHYQESHFPAFSNSPPRNVCTHPSQGFYGDSPHHFDRDERQRRYDAHSDAHGGWSRYENKEWCQLGEDYEWRQRYNAENDPHEHHCQPPDYNNGSHSSLVLILMRGLPGSGKSTLARELLFNGHGGLILSTDDYFAHRDGYRYEPGLLGAAHEWNQSRAKEAMQDGRSPLIIDNTNIQAWEMKPYVKMALEKGYKVDFCEPDTSWKFDPYELQKRNKHGVPHQKIAQMMDHFSFPISIDIVMSSQEPRHVNQRCRPEQPERMREKTDFY